MAAELAPCQAPWTAAAPATSDFIPLIQILENATLQIHGIWQSAIGFNPYAPTAKDSKPSSTDHPSHPSADDDADGENAYASF